jgi:hypothetical protein
VILNVHIWKPERKNSIESIKLIICTESDGSEVRYRLYHSSERGNVIKNRSLSPNATLLDRESLLNVKEQLGLHQYHVRS